MKLFQNKKKGFTLIELLVVIAIIGVLASVVLASLNSSRVKGRNAQMLATVKEVEKALNLHYSDTGAFPIQSGGTWVCIGNYSDNECFDTRFNPDTTLNTAMAPYMNFDSIIHGNQDSAGEGIIYLARNAGQGYEMVYILEGTSQDCPIGYNRAADQSSSGNTSCTTCGNYTGNPNCSDDQF